MYVGESSRIFIGETIGESFAYLILLLHARKNTHLSGGVGETSDQSLVIWVKVGLLTNNQLNNTSFLNVLII